MPAPDTEGNEENYSPEMDAHHLMAAEEVRGNPKRHQAALDHLESQKAAHQAAISRSKRHLRVGAKMKEVFDGHDEGQPRNDEPHTKGDGEE